MGMDTMKLEFPEGCAVKVVPKEGIGSPTKAATGARAEEQLQAELAESQQTMVQLQETAATRARAEAQLQREREREPAEAQALNVQLDEAIATQVDAGPGRR